ncbi:TetR family transcriptional regulator [Marmoricola endophyticus]|uniref:TetR family transcriptional regulator n=2 Tax=Marmoricola endophyticus TaxID=2040280 RepID=A0A917BN67_9ACTN|nr:TetR family transcriptional regulator [Marmoricola endophyticus]
MRVDAARNYVRILAAARAVVVHSGPDVALEQVASAAEVGIATLYRRFGDRGELLTAVALTALEDAERAARAAAADTSADGLTAVGHYLRSMVHSQAAAVVPMLLGRADVQRSALADAQERSANAVAALVDGAHADGSLSRRITAGDIGVLLVRLSRPLPGGLPVDVEHELQLRHLDVIVAGLAAVDGLTPDGPTLDDLGRTAGWA